MTKLKGAVEHDEAGELHGGWVIRDLEIQRDAFGFILNVISYTVKSYSRECCIFRRSLRATTYMQNIMMGDKKKYRISVEVSMVDSSGEKRYLLRLNDDSRYLKK